MIIFVRPCDLANAHRGLDIEAVCTHHFRQYINAAIYESELALYIPYDSEIVKVINHSEGLIDKYYVRRCEVIHAMSSMGQFSLTYIAEYEIKPPFDGKQAGWSASGEVLWGERPKKS